MRSLRRQLTAAFPGSIRRMGGDFEASREALSDFLQEGDLMVVFALPRQWSGRLCAMGMYLLVLSATTGFAANPSSLRRPIALELSADGKTLYVANSRSGSLSVIDLDSASVVKEIALGKKLSDLVRVSGKPLFLVTDEEAGELLLLQANGQDVAVQQRLPVSPYPVCVVVSPDQSRCYVTSIWSRRLSVIDLPAEKNQQAKVARVIDLPLAPRCQLLVRDGLKLIIGDAFGGRLAVFDTQRLELVGIREFPGHNVRGLGVSSDGRMLLIAHQMLNELAHTVRNDVHWGLLMSNDLRWLKLDAVLDPKADLYGGAHMHPLGEAGSATGDPAGLTVARDGTVVVALGGVGEVAVGREKDFSLYRIRVGRRPTDVAINDQGTAAYVVNTFGESVSILDLGERELKGKVRLGDQVDPTTLSEVDRGELLFYDASLSHDGWMSCHSCHTDGHTNGMLNDNFSDASFGAPKRVLSLLGRTGTEPFAWNAEAKDLVTQIRKSIANTLQSDNEPDEEQVAALAAYVRTLEGPPSIDRLRGVTDPAAIDRGSKQFRSLGCARCHRPPTYTTPRTYDVGLADKQGNNRFNPPTLRGVGQRGPYFHDNRAGSLEDVFRKHRHQLKQDLKEPELFDLLAFLRSL